MSTNLLAGIKRCTSPIELQLIHALSRQAGFEWREPNHHHWEVGRWPGWFLVLLAQPQYGSYRPDLAISTWVNSCDEGMPFVLIIEADGHDFHERTKEQALHDKRRDRYMTKTGARVLRFTGSEIYRGADECAFEVLEFAIKLQGPHLVEEFKKFASEASRSGAKRGDA